MHPPPLRWSRYMKAWAKKAPHTLPNTICHIPYSFQFSINTAILSVTRSLKWHWLSFLSKQEQETSSNSTPHEPFEPQTVLVSRPGWISVLPWNPLCSPYTTYWQCHLKRVFQHRSAAWHQTLAWCTKFTKTFGTLAWLTLEKHPFTHSYKILSL